MNSDEDYVWILFDRRGEVEGVYGNEDDALQDQDYLGTAYFVEKWKIDYQTVVVEG